MLFAPLRNQPADRRNYRAALHSQKAAKLCACCGASLQAQSVSQLLPRLFGHARDVPSSCVGALLGGGVARLSTPQSAGFVTAARAGPCQTPAMKSLSYLDVFAVLIAALCHDIDHPGHTNDFEVSRRRRVRFVT